MNTTEIILVRHGETEWNLSGRWQGHADSALSKRGVSQAEFLGKRIKSMPVDAVYSSDLERAMHTSRLAVVSSHWDALPMAELRERGLGVLEGMTTSEMQSKQSDVYHQFLNNGPEYQPPGGESFQQFFDRCSNAVENLVDMHPGKKILCFTHGGVLGVIFRKVLNLGLDVERNFLLLNCSINRIQKSNGKWHLVSWGDVAHLQELGSLDDS